MLWDNYFLIVRRIPGVSLSPDAYMDLDTFVTGHLLDREKEIMKKEEDEYNKTKGKGKGKSRGTNSEEMEEVMDGLQEEAE